MKKLIEKDNLYCAIYTVCKTHKYIKYHDANGNLVKFLNHSSLKILNNIDDYVDKLKNIIEINFEPSPMKEWIHYDKNAQKYRKIAEPKLWPDQCVHHALIQVLVPYMMKGMDYWCCGSIPGRGIAHGKKGIETWMKFDKKGTKYCLSLDIRHFYDTLNPEQVMLQWQTLIKDSKMLSIIWKIIKNGFTPGSYYAQWFANTFLQPLDRIIRQQKCVTHYIRYMDNFTIFSSNKRKLHKVKKIIEDWLNNHKLKVKPDWQIFNTWKRKPYALGYSYGHGFTILYKRNALKLKRQISKYLYKIKRHKKIGLTFACGLLSRLGQLKNCSSFNFYKYYVPKKLENKLKNIVRKEMKKIMIKNPIMAI